MTPFIASRLARGAGLLSVALVAFGLSAAPAKQANAQACIARGTDPVACPNGVAAGSPDVGFNADGNIVWPGGIITDGNYNVQPSNTEIALGLFNISNELGRRPASDFNFTDIFDEITNDFEVNTRGIGTDNTSANDGLVGPDQFAYNPFANNQTTGQFDPFGASEGVFIHPVTGEVRNFDPENPPEDIKEIQVKVDAYRRGEGPYPFDVPDKLSAIGDDAQLANIELQQKLQQQQQTVPSLCDGGACPEGTAALTGDTQSQPGSQTRTRNEVDDFVGALFNLGTTTSAPQSDSTPSGAGGVRLSGYGRFGLDYNEPGATVPTNSASLTSRLRLQFDMSAETDGGVVFGGRIRLRDETIHTVGQGENLFRIALRYGVSTSSLAVANGLANTRLIFVGQELKIPQAGGRSSGGPSGSDSGCPDNVGACSAAGDRKAAAFEDTDLNDARTNNETSHTVAGDDTLSEIARRYGVSEESIALANNLPLPGSVPAPPGRSGGQAAHHSEGRYGTSAV